MSVLYQAAANEASYDSGENYAHPSCHPRTRMDYLSFLARWSEGEGHHILWMYGAAGTGKSSIAQSFCGQLAAKGVLCASFFFKRDHPSRGHPNKIFSTLAYQLARGSSQFEIPIARSVGKDPAIFTKPLATQLQNLLVEVYEAATPLTPLDYAVLVIDGLDECSGVNGAKPELAQMDILRALGDAFGQREYPLRILIASRPEPHIRQIFDEPCLKASSDALQILGSREDIRTYLIDTFEKIRTTVLIRPAPWPEKRIVEHLVKKSSGHFIYAATVIRFVDDPDWDPRKRVDIIMGIREADITSDSPLAELDQLYIQILDTVRGSRDQLLQILSVLAAASELSQVGNFSVSDIAQLLRMDVGDVRLTMRRLHSVIRVPETDDNAVLMHHASFSDFLTVAARGKAFHFDHKCRNILALKVLQACCVENKDAESFFEHVSTRDLCVTFITTTAFRPEMITYLHGINLEPLFRRGMEDGRENIEVILKWLKRHHAPENVIKEWNDRAQLLSFANWCGRLALNSAKAPRADVQQTGEIPADPPRMVELIQSYYLFAFPFVSYPWDPIPHPAIFTIRHMLAFSWHDLMASAIALRHRYIGNEYSELLKDVFSPSQMRRSFPPARLCAIAERCLKLAIYALDHRLTGRPPNFNCCGVINWSADSRWSFILRACPPSQTLLVAVKKLFASPFLTENRGDEHHIHHIRAWLKTQPEPPLDLLDRNARRDRKKIAPSKAAHYERDWERWRKRTGLGYDTTAVDDVDDLEGPVSGQQGTSWSSSSSLTPISISSSGSALDSSSSSSSSSSS
ncbi:hypothetical protein R3P38DRAFT_3575663 [Favolaschia claudopus]|uniref:Nephrocystin 3-like N-terminal domain-containing protein n=1 Tax=Favolaschia claudopus TaxID=2862362 RepID=A0AAW0ALY2_9AGAR